MKGLYEPISQCAPCKVTFSAIGGCGHDFNLSVWDTVIEFAAAALEAAPLEDSEGVLYGNRAQKSVATWIEVP